MVRAESPSDRRRAVVILAALVATLSQGCEAAGIVLQIATSPAAWNAADTTARVVRSNEPYTPPSPEGPVVDSLAEDARFVASRIVSCPLDDTRIVRRTRHRFTAVGCGRVTVLRCHAPRDGSPTRCRELHPPPESQIADARPPAAERAIE